MIRVKNVSAYLDEPFILRMRVVPRSEQISSSLFGDGDFLLYRKFLKSSEIVYNGLEIKNDITKERRGLRHDVVYEVFCFGLG